MLGSIVHRQLLQVADAVETEAALVQELEYVAMVADRGKMGELSALEIAQLQVRTCGWKLSQCHTQQ